MKKKRNVIIAAAVIAALIAGIFIVSSIDTEKKDAPAEGGRTDSYTVCSAETSELESVTVKSENGEITAVNNGKSDWTIDLLPAEDVDKQKAYNLAATVSTIISKNRFEADDLNKYGLQSPAAEVTVKRKDGSSDTLYIGDLSPTLGEYFFMLDGDNSVYTIYTYKVETLLRPREFYTEFNRFSVVIDDITDIKIKRSDETIEIRLAPNIDENTNNVWEMVSPYESAANDDYIDNKILAPLENIALSSPLDGMESAVSSDAPEVELTIVPYDNATGKRGEEYTETFTVGKTEGETAYVKYKGNIYATPASSVDFVNESAFNIVSKMQALVDISKVKSVTLEYEGESHTIGIKNENANKYSFTLDGKETDSKVSQNIYRSVISLAADGLYDGAETGEAILKITFNGKKSADNTVVEIKKLDDISCAIERDGRTEFTIKRNKIDDFLSIFKLYVKEAGGAE